MAASLNIPDVITGEPILFTLEPASGTAVQLAGVVDPSTIKISGGEKDGEGQVMASGGRAWKQKPQGDYTIEFDAYTVGVISTGGASMFGIAQFFDGQTLDAVEPIKTNNQVAIAPTRYRVSFMQTEDTTATSAAGAVATTKWGYRLAFANARITKYEYTYADQVWKVSVSMKCPAFKKAGTANRQEESSDGSDAGGMPTLGAYTNANNW